MKGLLTLVFCVVTAGFLWGQSFDVTASYSSETGHAPAVIPMGEIDPTLAIVRLNEEEGTMQEAIFYFYKSDGTTETEKVTSYSYPLYERFLVDPARAEEYERIEVYLNGEQGSTPFNQGVLNVSVENRPFVEGFIEGIISYSADGTVNPAVFPMDQVLGADFFFVEMESGSKPDLVINARNPESNASERQQGSSTSHFTGGGASYITENVVNRDSSGHENIIVLNEPVGVANPERFTELVVSIAPDSVKEGHSDTGIVLVSTMSAEDRQIIQEGGEKSEKAHDAALNTLLILILVAVNGGYVFTRFLYRPMAKKLVESRFLFFISGTRLLIIATTLIWIGAVYLIWLSPIIPGNDVFTLVFLEVSLIFWFFLTTFPIILDKKYNVCKKCKQYGTFYHGGRQNMGGKETTYTASTKDEKINAGSDKQDFYNDAFVCSNCGHEKRQGFGIFSGSGRENVSMDSSGKLYRSDMINAGFLINIMLTISQPYNWFRFYRSMGLVR